MFRAPLTACIVVMFITFVCSEKFLEGLENEDIRAVRHRLAEEKEKRLLLQNDVEVLMLKVAKLERVVLDGSNENCPKTQQKTNTIVAFHASYSKGHLTLEPGTILVFDKVLANHGSGYSAVTGIFRAPVRGTYLFTIHLLSYTSADLHIGIFKTGTQVANTYVPTNNTGSQSVVVDLEIGEEVYVRAFHRQGGAHGTGYCTFTGLMIH